MAPSLVLDQAIREVRAADVPEITVRSLDANPRAAPEESTLARLAWSATGPRRRQPGMVLMRAPIAVRFEQSLLGNAPGAAGQQALTASSNGGIGYDDRYREVVQRREGIRLHHA